MARRKRVPARSPIGAGLIQIQDRARSLLLEPLPHVPLVQSRRLHKFRGARRAALREQAVQPEPITDIDGKHVPRADRCQKQALDQGITAPVGRLGAAKTDRSWSPLIVGHGTRARLSHTHTSVARPRRPVRASDPLQGSRARPPPTRGDCKGPSGGTARPPCASGERADYRSRLTPPLSKPARSDQSAPRPWVIASDDTRACRRLPMAALAFGREAVARAGYRLSRKASSGSGARYRPGRQVA